ncbi:MAG: hypothetical protein ACPGSD_07700 [Flavobacteriales bacterium]
MEVKKDIEKILKDGLRKSFESGYTAKNKTEALNGLSESLGNDIINYLQNYSNSTGEGIDLNARVAIKELIAEIATIRVDIGVSVDKERLNEIKNKL